MTSFDVKLHCHPSDPIIGYSTLALTLLNVGSGDTRLRPDLASILHSSFQINEPHFMKRNELWLEVSAQANDSCESHGTSCAPTENNPFTCT